MSAADYAEARYQLALVRKAGAAVFDDVDVLERLPPKRAILSHRVVVAAIPRHFGERVHAHDADAGVQGLLV